MSQPPAPLVVHVIHRLHAGGLENGLVNLINNMPPEMYRHVIVCLAGSSDFRNRIQRSDVEVISLDKKPGKDWWAYGRMWKLLRRIRPDIVHTRNFGTIDMQWIAWIAGVRVRIHGEHGWAATDVTGSNQRHLRIRRACSPVIQRYVAVSRNIESWMQSRLRIPAGRIRQIYNGVDCGRFSDKVEYPADFPWPEGDLVIGTVGRLDPIKNHDLLLRSFRDLVSIEDRLGQRLRLLIVGDGSLYESLKASIESSSLADRVWLAGGRNDIPELMRCMNVFVLPSLNEGISNTILEAMAMGLPVVAARVGGNPELIVNDVTGILYDDRLEGGLIQALRKLIESAELRQRLGSAAKVSVNREFGISSMVSNYLSLYHEALCAV